MIRLMIAAMILCGMALTMIGCTNTVRGIGRDVNSNSIQNYNTRTVSDY